MLWRVMTLSELLLELHILILILQLLRISNVRCVLFQKQYGRKVNDFFIYLTAFLSEVKKNRELWT